MGFVALHNIKWGSRGIIPLAGSGAEPQRLPSPPPHTSSASGRVTFRIHLFPLSLKKAITHLNS